MNELDNKKHILGNPGEEILWPADPENAITDYRGENASENWRDKPKPRKMLKDLMMESKGFRLRKTTRAKLSKQHIKEYDDYKRHRSKLRVEEKRNEDRQMREAMEYGSNLYTPFQIKEALMSEKVKGMEYAKLMLSRTVLHNILQFEDRQRKADFRNVDLGNVEWVKTRIGLYFNSMAKLGMFPSVNGLCVQGFGISRGVLYQYLSDHDDESTDIIKQAITMITDILVETALTGGSNASAAIFELKNNHGYSDVTHHITQKVDPLGGQESTEALAEKYRAQIGYTKAKDVTNSVFEAESKEITDDEE